jgi:hypothetical protein
MYGLETIRRLNERTVTEQAAGKEEAEPEVPRSGQRDVAPACLELGDDAHV